MGPSMSATRARRRAAGPAGPPAPATATFQPQGADGVTPTGRAARYSSATGSSSGAGGGATDSAGLGLVLSSSTSRQSDWSSRIKTLNDSGRPGVNDASPFTMAS